MPIVAGRVPEIGDVYWIDHGEPVGHEQGGRRPSIILTPASYNAASSVVLTCPITRRRRNWPFEVAISAVGRIEGFALVDQIRVVDLEARAARLAGSISAATLAAIRERVGSLMNLREPQ